MNKTTVIYHSADYDGIFCREIARKFLPDSELIGWNFGDPKVSNPMDGGTYVLDLSPDCLNYVNPSQLIWIDHHKTSIEKWPADIPGYRIDGVAACRLAWQWFIAHESFDALQAKPRPNKEDFVNRRVTEPLAVRLAGEYDIWDKRDPAAEVFQYGLSCQKEIDWNALLSEEKFRDDGTPTYLEDVILAGMNAQAYAQHVDASICNSLTWLMKWEGLTFLCVNHARFNSLLFAAKDVPETGHDALLGFRFDGKSWMVSLYHSKHRTDLDLSEIAKKYGGGGHKGACGFTCAKLPFNF